jgi:hypothetical protein
MTQRRNGTVTFAALLILTAGVLDLVWGISALSNRGFFHSDELLFESLTTWGWVYIVVGAIQLVVGAMVLTERPLGFALGIFGAFLSILVNFLSIGAYPIWSCLLIGLGFFVMFALATNLDD